MKALSNLSGQCRINSFPCYRHQTARRRVTVSCSSQGVSDAQSNQGTKVTLRMPVGLVFAQKASGAPVVVDEVTPGGAADKAGSIAKGDLLTSCSAVVLKSGRDGNMDTGHGEFLYDNWERVMFDCKDQEFKTVMSALKSNNPRWGFNDVILVFNKPEQQQAASA